MPRVGQPLFPAAAAATRDETLARAIQVLAAMYGFDGTDLRRTLVDTSGHQLIAGPAADNAAAVGNPVRAGAVYQSTEQAYAAADISDLHADPIGSLVTVRRGRLITIHASAARTASFTGADVSGFEWYRMCMVYLDVTAVTGTSPTMDLRHIGRLRAGISHHLARTASITATGRWAWLLSPEGEDAGLAPFAAETPPAAGGLVNAPSGPIQFIDVVIGGTTPSFTFTLEAFVY